MSSTSIISSYIAYLSAATCAGAAQSILSNKAMLDTVDKFKPVQNQTNQYIAKEVPGLIGAWAAANWVGKMVDRHPARSLWKAVALQQVCWLGETSSPFLSDPQWFLPVVATCCVGKNISWTAMGAVQAKCVQALASSPSELGAMYTRVTKWITLASALGMSIGLWFEQQHNEQHNVETDIKRHTTRLAIAGPILGLVQIICCRKAVRLVYPPS